MAEKSINDQIAENEAERERLNAKQEELKRQAAHQEYPKYIPDPTDETGQSGRSVANAAEEKAVLASYEKKDTKAAPVPSGIRHK